MSLVAETYHTHLDRRNRVVRKHADVIAILKEGWRLKSSAGTGTAHAWFTDPTGVKHLTVAIDAVFTLVSLGQIDRVPRQKTDPFWLTNYRLVPTCH